MFQRLQYEEVRSPKQQVLNGRSGRSAEVHADFTTDRLLSYTGRPVTQG
jgi:hypothetical protein